MIQFQCPAGHNISVTAALIAHRRAGEGVAATIECFECAAHDVPQPVPVVPSVYELADNVRLKDLGANKFIEAIEPDEPTFTLSEVVDKTMAWREGCTNGKTSFLHEQFGYSPWAQYADILAEEPYVTVTLRYIVTPAFARSNAFETSELDENDPDCDLADIIKFHFESDNLRDSVSGLNFRSIEIALD